MKIKIVLTGKNWFGQGSANIELEADTIEDMEKLFELSEKVNFKVKM